MLDLKHPDFPKIFTLMMIMHRLMTNLIHCNNKMRCMKWRLIIFLKWKTLFHPTWCSWRDGKIRTQGRNSTFQWWEIYGRSSHKGKRKFTTINTNKKKQNMMNMLEQWWQKTLTLQKRTYRAKNFSSPFIASKPSWNKTMISLLQHKMCLQWPEQQNTLGNIY